MRPFCLVFSHPCPLTLLLSYPDCNVSAEYSTATQFVVEEKIMERYSVAPLVAVGFEGLFGAISIVIAMPILGLFKDRSMFFDLPRGWHQMIDTPTVLWSGIAIAISISLFNFFGLSVTRHGVCSFPRQIIHPRALFDRPF